MPPLPVVSGPQMVAALRRVGYQVVRQKGSHVRLRCPGDAGRVPTTVSCHGSKALKPGTLRAILRDANLTVDEFLGLL